MTNAEFLDVMRAASLLAQVADDDNDYGAALEELERADAFGCFVDPTAWQRGLGDRAEAKKLLTALVSFKAAARGFLAAAVAKGGGA